MCAAFWRSLWCCFSAGLTADGRPITVGVALICEAHGLVALDWGVDASARWEIAEADAMRVWRDFRTAVSLDDATKGAVPFARTPGAVAFRLMTCWHFASRYLPLVLACIEISACRSGFDGDDQDGSDADGGGVPCNASEDPFSEFDQDTGHCLRVFPDSAPWAQAQFECEMLGGTLAVVGSDHEHGLVSDLAAIAYAETGVDDYWVGYRRESVGGEFEWVDGDPSGAAFWANGEPNETGSTACAYAYQPSDWLWHDALCSDGELGYVCEWEPA